MSEYLHEANRANNDESRLVKYKQRDIISQLHKRTNIKIGDLKYILDVYQDIITDMLLSAGKDNDVEIKLYDGLYLKSDFKVGGEVYRPDLKETVGVTDYIHVYPRMTRSYKNKIRELYRRGDAPTEYDKVLIINKSDYDYDESEED